MPKRANFSSGPHVPWFYKGKPCQPIAVLIEDNTVIAIIIDLNGTEIRCDINNLGEYDSLSYGSH